MLLADGSQAVVFELAVAVLGRRPLRGQPTLLLQPVQRRIERSVFDLKHIVTGALDVLGNLVSVSWAELQGAKDQHVQSALQQFGAFVSRHDGR